MDVLAASNGLLFKQLSARQVPLTVQIATKFLRRGEIFAYIYDNKE
ncbi:hypothetical protein FHW96_002295 [Novosphingobium sp. SG751A]|nr:hypothetical protein [Novosphingobium sp. SG751A]NOW46137.1 hypothetical protein [Novosphingobium sp. SG751A]